MGFLLGSTGVYLAADGHEQDWYEELQATVDTAMMGGGCLLPFYVFIANLEIMVDQLSQHAGSDTNELDLVVQQFGRLENLILTLLCGHTLEYSDLGKDDWCRMNLQLLAFSTHVFEDRFPGGATTSHLYLRALVMTFSCMNNC